MGGEITEVLVEFDRSGSLPTTHDSQGSDMGLFGGLLGWNADDDRLPESGRALHESGIQYRIEVIDVGDPHPNTYRLTLQNAQEKHSLIAISTGGGMMEVLSIDGIPMKMDGGYFETLVWVSKENTDCTALLTKAESISQHPTPQGTVVQIQSRSPLPDSILNSLGGHTIKRLAPVLPVMSRKGLQLPFQSCSTMLAWDGKKQTPLWELAVEYERVRGELTSDEVMAKMIEIVRILRKSIQQGVAGTHYDDRVLGYQSGQFATRMKQGALLEAGALNRMILYVTAMMEVKSSMGVIVAAPTAGACAALPGAVVGMAESMGKGEVEMAQAMLAAGLIGVFIASQWTFAAEVGGCQAEGGSAASMAAAALVTLAGGTRDQAVAAASLALQSMLGLICDPIANRVEAPCLGKNVMAASNALSCANMALADFDPLIPLDEVIEAAKRVSERMPREHRCTSLGGLAVTPTSLAIEKRLAAQKQSCGPCRCG